MDAKPAETSKGTKLGISLASGTVAGVAAAICSHPADTLFSLMNKPGAGGEGSMFARMSTIAGEMGFYKLATQGLGARCIMYDSPRPIHAIAALHPTRRPAQDLGAGQRGKRIALPHSKTMIHQPMGGARGQAEDIRIQAEQIMKIKASLVDEYAMMTGQTRERIEADLDRDNYMTAVQAKAYGLVDEVVDRIGVKGADTEYS